jgi:hypothetical protein
MTEQPKSETPQGWNLLWDFLRDKPIIDVFVTSGYFFLKPLKFTGEVIREDWTHKAKPPRFLVETYLLALVLILVTPWRILDEFDGSLTNTQKAFLTGAGAVGFFCSFFAASFIAHCILGRQRLPFIRAFFLFCYIQGTQLILAHVIVGLVWLLHGESPSQGALLFTALLEFILFLISIIYVIVPVARAYSPRWYRLVFSGVVALVVFIAINLGFSYVAEVISARFPSQ